MGLVQRRIEHLRWQVQQSASAEAQPATLQHDLATGPASRVLPPHARPGAHLGPVGLAPRARSRSPRRRAERPEEPRQPGPVRAAVPRPRVVIDVEESSGGRAGEVSAPPVSNKFLSERNFVAAFNAHSQRPCVCGSGHAPLHREALDAGNTSGFVPPQHRLQPVVLEEANSESGPWPPFGARSGWSPATDVVFMASGSQNGFLCGAALSAAGPDIARNGLRIDFDGEHGQQFAMIIPESALAGCPLYRRMPENDNI